MTSWDPALYLDFDDHRARPFHDLLARIGATAPRRVVDLGCGPPGNFGAPSHELVRELLDEPRWRGRVTVRGDAVAEPSAYADLMASTGADVDVWETTYPHRLTGDDPVLNWIKEQPYSGSRCAGTVRLSRLPVGADPATPGRLSDRCGRHHLVPIPPDLRRGSYSLAGRH